MFVDSRLGYIAVGYFAGKNHPLFLKSPLTRTRCGNRERAARRCFFDLRLAPARRTRVLAQILNWNKVTSASLRYTTNDATDNIRIISTYE
jgi:hypothetical protein